MNDIREAGEILDLGSGGELSARHNVVGHPSFEEDRPQLRPRGVYSGGVDGWAS